MWPVKIEAPQGSVIYICNVIAIFNMLADTLELTSLADLIFHIFTNFSLKLTNKKIAGLNHSVLFVLQLIAEASLLEISRSWGRGGYGPNYVLIAALIQGFKKLFYWLASIFINLRPTLCNKYFPNKLEGGIVRWSKNFKWTKCTVCNVYTMSTYLGVSQSFVVLITIEYVLVIVLCRYRSQWFIFLLFY